MADEDLVSQDEINEMLNQGGDATAKSPESASGASDQKPPLVQSAGQSGDVTQNDIELLLNKAEEALDSIDNSAASPDAALPAGIKTFDFKPFSGTAANKESATLELMSDVQLDMTIELGRTHMQLEDVLKLKQGSVVPLDKLAGDPADIYVNGRLVARGEILVLNDNFCIRVAELIVGESACAS